MINNLTINVIKINTTNIITKMAISDEDQRKGLMNVNTQENMIFPYKKSQINSFWMKSTPMPLDIVFCLDGKIIKICEGKPFSTEMIGNVLSDLVLEFPKGTCKSKNINVGDQVKLSIPINHLGDEFNNKYKWK